jgi:hypothetical protein
MSKKQYTHPIPVTSFDEEVALLSPGEELEVRSAIF